MNKLVTVKILMVLFLASILISCSSMRPGMNLYEGERNDNEIAIVRRVDTTIKVISIDGVSDGRMFSPDFYKILPGQHTFELSFSYANQYGTTKATSNQNVTFTAVEGGRYVIRPNERGITWKPSIDLEKKVFQNGEIIDYSNQPKLIWQPGKSSITSLFTSLKDSNWEIRRQAADVLGEIGDNSAVEPLINTLNDQDWMVRRSSVQALTKIGDIRAFTPLELLYKNETDNFVRKAIQEGLERLKNPQNNNDSKQ